MLLWFRWVVHSARRFSLQSFKNFLSLIISWDSIQCWKISLKNKKSGVLLIVLNTFIAERTSKHQMQFYKCNPIYTRLSLEKSWLWSNFSWGRFFQYLRRRFTCVQQLTSSWYEERDFGLRRHRGRIKQVLTRRMTGWYKDATSSASGIQRTKVWSFRHRDTEICGDIPPLSFDEPFYPSNACWHALARCRKSELKLDNPWGLRSAQHCHHHHHCYSPISKIFKIFLLKFWCGFQVWCQHSSDTNIYYNL